MKNVDLIILCGGFGTRLKTVSKNTQKFFVGLMRGRF